MAKEKRAWQNTNFRIIDGGTVNDGFSEQETIDNVVDFREWAIRAAMSRQNRAEDIKQPGLVESMILEAKQRFFAIFNK